MVFSLKSLSVLSSIFTSLTSMMASSDHLDELRTASLQAFEQEIQKNPRTVYLAWRVLDLSNLNSIDSTVDVDFYLYARWYDPSMKESNQLTAQAPFGRTADEYEQLWNPCLEINNGQDMVQLLSPDHAWNLKDKETGMMKYTQHFRGELDIELDVAHFPFDTSMIPINIGCKVSPRRAWHDTVFSTVSLHE
jgi:hypothetical protein